MSIKKILTVLIALLIANSAWATGEPDITGINHANLGPTTIGGTVYYVRAWRTPRKRYS